MSDAEPEPTPDPTPAEAPVEAPAEPPVTAGQVFGWAVAGALGVLVVALAAVAVYAVRTVLVQLIVAVFIAVSLDPLVRWMMRRGVSRGPAVAVIFLLLLASLAGLGWLFVPPLVEQVTELASDTPGFLDRLRERSPALADLEKRFDLRSKVDAFAADLPARFTAQALGLAQTLFGAIISTLLTIVLTIYVMVDLPRLRRGLVRLFLKRHRSQAAGVVDVVVDKVGAYMIGNLLISVIAGLAAYAALSALRVPFALPLALLIAVLDLIPLVGATLGAVVCVGVAAATVPLWPHTAVLAVFFLLYQQLENYLIAPRVLRGTVQISSFAVLMAALVGASLLGLLGALLAIPIAAAGKVILADRLRARDEAEAEAAAEAAKT